jgi:hypothetical protein
VSEEIPLAIGWAASVEDTVSTGFMAAFYRSLAAGESIDRALVDGRDAMRPAWEDWGDPSWALPVLYAATDQAHVVDPDPAHPREVPPRRGVVQRALPGMTEGHAASFVGRRREQQRLLPALRDGSIRVLVITGLGGSGKSTLATRIANKLEANGFGVIPIPSGDGKPVSVGRLIEACAGAFHDGGRPQERDTL